MDYTSLSLEDQKSILRDRLANYERIHFEATCAADEFIALGEEGEPYQAEIQKVEQYGRIIALLKLKLETVGIQDAIFLGEDE